MMSAAYLVAVAAMADVRMEARLRGNRPGLPPAWRDGVAQPACPPTLDSTTPARWADLTSTSTRLFLGRGAEHDGAAWDVFDRFGPHPRVPEIGCIKMERIVTTHRSKQDAGRATQDSGDALCPGRSTPGLTPPDGSGADGDQARVGDGPRAVSIPQPALPSLKGLTAADAAVLDAEAAKKRAELANMFDPVRRAQQQAEAAGIEALAVRLRDPALCGVPELRLGRGGEMTPLPESNMPFNIREAALVVQAPSGMLAAEASLDRLTMARDAGVLTLAVEAAESVGADGAVQQMLAHEIAAAHKLAMRLMASADAELGRHERDRVMRDAPSALADAARSATAAARLMDSVTRAALVLDRLRHGSRQQVVVQHVSVQDGGQAVVAGSVAPGGGIAARTRGGSGE